MNELIMLHGPRIRKILEMLVEKRIPATMTFLKAHEWNTARVLFTYLEDNRFDIKLTPKKANQPLPFDPGQTVGISFKCGYGSGYDQFIFDTKILGLKPASGSKADGDICLAIPEQIEMVQRRNYQRISVPTQLDRIDVLAWHHVFGQDNSQILARKEFHFDLVDISASGIQIAIDAEQKPDFQFGQSISVKFIALPDQTPVMFTAQVKSILPTADGQGICFGLQTIGLEASPEGRLVLLRLCNIVEEYKQMNIAYCEKQPAKPANLQ